MVVCWGPQCTKKVYATDGFQAVFCDMSCLLAWTKEPGDVEVYIRAEHEVSSSEA